MSELLEIFKKQELDQKRLNMNYHDAMLLEKYHYTYFLKVINKSDKIFGCYFESITVFHNDLTEICKTHKLCEVQSASMFPEIEKI